MTEQPPRDWDKELADIDRAIAKQGGPPGSAPVPAGGTPRRRFVALAWFWTLLAIVLGVALIIWPFDRTCGIRLIFFLGAALMALVVGGVGSFTSYAHRQGLALVLSLLVILWAGVVAAREVLPRAGYAKQARDWTCPPPPPVPDPAPAPSQ
jgi:hypothetical protein